jgi:predicted metal-binding protein
MTPGEDNEYYFTEDHMMSWVSGKFKWDCAPEDIEYAKDYGITDIEEIETMYSRYMKKLCGLILQKIQNREGQLNESMEKIDSYLKRVVDWLVEDTKYTINYGGHMSTVDIHFPMNDYDQPTEYSVGEIYRDALPELMRSSGSWNPVYSESKYISDQYGLYSDTEIKKVFKDYLKILFTNIVEDAKRIKRINRGGSVNESMGRRKEYLEEIIKYLVDDTIINYNLSTVVYPFMESSIGTYTFTPATLFSSQSPFSFENYVIDNYSITLDEANYVWRKYSDILMYKFKSGRSINESINRMSREEYLDKVSDFLVDDTIIVQNNIIEPPYYYGIGGRSHFSGLYNGTFVDSGKPYNPVEVHMIYFRRYVMSNYDITPEEIPAMWETYITKLNNKLGNLFT